MTRRAQKMFRSGLVSLVAVFAITLFLPLASASAAGNVVADGNFATPAAPTNSFTDFAAPNTFGSWTVVSGSVDVCAPSSGLPIPPGDPAGTQTVDMDGVHPGEIQQALTGLVPNATYTGTFELNANGNGPDTNKTLNVLNGATVLSSYTYLATTPGYGGATGWLAETFSFTADASGDATLGFQSTDPAASDAGAR